MSSNTFEDKYYRFIERDRKYTAQGEEFAKNCIDNFYPEEVESMWEEGEFYLTDYIGSVMSIFPSGKYYMPWCSNFTWKDAAQDYCFREGLESILEDNGYWLESGEGDPTDLFICKNID